LPSLPLPTKGSRETSRAAFHKRLLPHATPPALVAAWIVVLSASCVGACRRERGRHQVADHAKGDGRNHTRHGIR
jgi:hypothetical protein